MDIAISTEVALFPAYKGGEARPSVATLIMQTEPKIYVL